MTSVTPTINAETAPEHQRVIILDPARDDPEYLLRSDWKQRVREVAGWCGANLDGCWEIHENYFRNQLWVMVDSDGDAMMVRMAWH